MYVDLFNRHFLLSKTRQKNTTPHRRRFPAVLVRIYVRTCVLLPQKTHQCCWWRRWWMNHRLWEERATNTTRMKISIRKKKLGIKLAKTLMMFSLQFSRPGTLPWPEEIRFIKKYIFLKFSMLFFLSRTLLMANLKIWWNLKFRVKLPI